MAKITQNNEDSAIVVESVSKIFRIPHEKVDSLRGAFIGAFKGRRTYEEFSALNNVSFSVKKGEFFGIIGRNGSGKSTLLKILAGIYQPDSGTVTVNGRISPFLELGIGFNPELSGRDNVYLNATVLGLTKKEIDEKFNDIVAFAELERFIDQKLKNYSSGMQVRLAFAVSIHANRDILLMDEVLAVGDNNFQSKCLEEFAKYRAMGRTVIIVTHDISVVQRYCDRALLLRNGHIQMIGDSEEIGNEYIYQNMSDEERRITSEECRTNVTNGEDDGHDDDSVEFATQKAKIAEITNVEFLDKNGKKKNVFQTGDDIAIQVFFHRRDAETHLNIGIGLWCDDGSYVFSYNTQMDDYNIPQDTESITLLLKDVPLLQGGYYINVVCFGREEQDYIDLKQRLRSFHVFPVDSTNKYRGVMNVQHSWKA